MNDKVKTTMKLADGQKWREFVDAQGVIDPFTGTVLSYAVIWAEKMEEKLKDSVKLTKELAEAASDETAKETGGITMAMFGQCLNILCNHWARGKELQPLYA